ncbi:SGNH/GDSL hydrolase family protein [Pseudonocardia sp. DSM 110487]|uniref:SGNH/GDSL hydrolase family protein n=1 Tax=Pseudonocardia sp. DSM 110487 TaxID=2865833 RepID=UPI001C6A5F7D|nr:SGNH/GDSL hydrolase family protein [Pseudonocardia sp. DSM 110487]QYN34910.1 SGNH/GDSL hydrolase family protein [Pseudonocardia sp. DSM 110487]
MGGVGSWLGRGLLVIAVLLLVLVGVSAGAVPVQRSAAAAPAPAPLVLRVMPLGASSTAGNGSPETAGYRGPLQMLLARDGVTVDMVGSQRSAPPSVPDGDYEGNSGLTLTDMRPRVAQWVRRADPDVVLLHIGTNDLLKGDSAEKTVRRLEDVLSQIVAVSDAHVIVAGVWAPLPGDARDRAEFNRLSAAVVAQFRQRGSSMRFLDVSEPLESDELADGLHPNATGYRMIAAMWERQILEVIGRRAGS